MRIIRPSKVLFSNDKIEKEFYKLDKNEHLRKNQKI